jgi:bis(5'-adenosyl)-triphosphatase
MSGAVTKRVQRWLDAHNVQALCWHAAAAAAVTPRTGDALFALARAGLEVSTRPHPLGLAAAGRPAVSGLPAPTTACVFSPERAQEAAHAVAPAIVLGASAAATAAVEPCAAAPAPPLLHLPECRDLADFAEAALGRRPLAARSALSFGPHAVSVAQVFYATRHAVGLVNLKPVVPGHVLILSRRRVPRLAALAPHELGEVWAAAQLVGARLEGYHGGTSLSVALQDGPQAGQTVPHVHVHLLPRHPDDLPDNDRIYDMIDASGEGAHAPADTAAAATGGGAPQQPRRAGGHSVAVDPLGGAAAGAGGSSRQHHHHAPSSSAAASAGGSGSGGGGGGMRSLHGPGAPSTPVQDAVVRGRPLDVPMTREPRSMAAMAAEAAAYRELFADVQDPAHADWLLAAAAGCDDDAPAG